jgi:hypothetical protein
MGIVQAPLSCRINYLRTIVSPCGHSGRYCRFQGGKLNRQGSNNWIFQEWSRHWNEKCGSHVTVHSYQQFRYVFTNRHWSAALSSSCPPLWLNLVYRLAVGNSISSKERSDYCLCKKWEGIERHYRLLRAFSIFGGMTPGFLIVGAALMWVVDLTPQPLYSLSKASFRYVGWKIMWAPEPVSTWWHREKSLSWGRKWISILRS